MQNILHISQIRILLPAVQMITWKEYFDGNLLHFWSQETSSEAKSKLGDLKYILVHVHIKENCQYFQYLHDFIFRAAFDHFQTISPQKVTFPKYNYLRN